MYVKKVDPLALAKSTHICSDGLKQHSHMPCFTRLDRVGEAKCLYGEMLALLG